LSREVLGYLQEQSDENDHGEKSGTDRGIVPAFARVMLPSSGEASPPRSCDRYG
jgi:hypothetical protein